MVHLRNELLASATAYSGGLSASKSPGSSSQALTHRSTDTFSRTLHQLNSDGGENDLARDTESGRTIAARQNAVTGSGANSETESTPIPAYLIGFNALVPRDTSSSTTEVDPTTSASADTSSSASLIGFNALVPRDTVAATTSAQTGAATTDTASPPGSSSPFKHWYADNAADDAYWSQQPAAVQQLREIQDPAQRAALAAQLSSEGYTIDNAIMVWGWDAGLVTTARQADGYTWVPSATQANVTAAPGLTGAGITPYDPTSPPPGSIAVPAPTTPTTPAMS